MADMGGWKMITRKPVAFGSEVLGNKRSRSEAARQIMGCNAKRVAVGCDRG